MRRACAALLACLACAVALHPQPRVPSPRRASSPLTRRPALLCASGGEQPAEPTLLAAVTSPQEAPPDSRAALLVLFMVPVAWGTYGPSIKSLYALDAPPPELLFTWMNYIVSSAALTAASILRPPEVAASADASADASPDAAADASADVKQAALLAGAELGGYLFLGSTIQIFGMRYTTAGRAAFIVQLTTVIVPLLEGLLTGKAPSRPTLAACALAFCGVALLVTAGSQGLGGLSSTSLGDGLIGLSALAYSLHVVRLAHHAPRLPPILLARSKEFARLALASVTLAGGVYLSSGQSAALSSFANSFSLAPTGFAIAMAIVLWNGLVTTALPTWAQSFGQRAVPAGTASVVYATQPLWSAFFGYLLLGETFGGQALVGAAVILAAVLLASAELAREQGAGEEGDSGGKA